MIITNDHNLPSPLVLAVSSGNYPPKDGRISVTTLINPEQQETLRRQHFEEIEEDAANRIWMLLGSSVHYILDKYGQRAQLPVEEKLEYPVRPFLGKPEWIVSGRSDLLEDGVLSDYKITSVWAFLLGDKLDWEQQANVYRVMHEARGDTVEKLQIVAILRDWKKREARTKGEEYPKVQVLIHPVRMWDLDNAKHFIETRVKAHVEAIEKGITRGCSDDERWLRGEKWAVKKKGNKNAMSGGLHDSQADAVLFASGKSVPTEIEHRPGVNVRCEDFCPVMPWCEQARELGINNGGGEMI